MPKDEKKEELKEERKSGRKGRKNDGRKYSGKVVL